MARFKIEPKLNISNISTVDNVFIKMSALTAISVPIPRNQVTVPISPVPQPTGIEAFESPAGGRLQYLPVYSLQQANVGGVDRVAIEFLHDVQVDRWGLRVTLLKIAPDLLTDVANRMDPMDHDVTIAFSYKPIPEGATRREHVFEDVTHGDSTITATLWAGSIAERDAFYQALTTETSQAQLSIIRHISVAIKTENETGGIALLENGTTMAGLIARQSPRISRAQLRRTVQVVPATSVTINRAELSQAAINTFGKRDVLPKPRVVVTGFKRVTFGGSKAVEIEFTIKNIRSFGAALFRRNRRMLGITRKRPARLLIEVFDPEANRLILRDGMRVQGPSDSIRKLTFVPVNGRIPKSVVFRLIDTKRNRRVESDKILLRKQPELPPVIIPPAATYTVVNLALPQVIEPRAFTFPADQHPHIYAALAVMPPVPVLGGLARHRESYEGRVHSYFQDAISPRTIFFLPDTFKIDRNSGVFRTPQATVRVRTEGNHTNTSEVTMDYVIAPYVDLARLSDAAEKISAATGIDAETMEFQPYLTENLSYSLSRPSVDGRTTEDRPTSSLMLQEPMVDTLVLPVADFQIAFDAMVGNTVSVITGQITFEIDGWGRETRGVVLDFKDLCGTALDVDNVSLTPADHAGTVNLINMIESNLVMEDVVVMATRDGFTTPVSGLEMLNNSGTLLMPGESETIPVTYADLPGTGPVTFEVLKSGRVVPDADAIMNSILDRSSLEYFREIDVRTVPTIFPDPADNPPSDGIFALMVEFENGQAVVLDRISAQQTVQVDFPFSDVILGHEADDGSYRYFRTIVRFDGTQERDATANVSTSPVLFVTPMVNVSAPPNTPGTD